MGARQIDLTITNFAEVKQLVGSFYTEDRDSRKQTIQKVMALMILSHQYKGT